MNTPIMKTTMREGLVGARHGNGSTQHKEESEQHLNNKKQKQIYEIPGKYMIPSLQFQKQICNKYKYNFINNKYKVKCNKEIQT